MKHLAHKAIRTGLFIGFFSLLVGCVLGAVSFVVFAPSAVMLAAADVRVKEESRRP